MISRGMRGAGSGPPNTSARAYSYSRRLTPTRAPQRPSSATQKNRRFIMVGFCTLSSRFSNSVILSSSFNVKILVALADGEGGGPWEEFMAEDFCDEDVLGHVFGFKAVAADSGVGASQVAWFPGKGEGAEGSRNVFGELRAGGGVDGIGGGKGFEGSEFGEFGRDICWFEHDGERTRITWK